MKRILLIISLAFPLLVMSQDPSSVRWKQIKTNNFKLIFPNGYDSTAKRIGSMLQIENEYEIHNMKMRPAPISIVLHNQLTMSNSWVALGPRRMELFHTPPQSSISPMDWNASLVLHEYRHVIQYDMLKEGFAGKVLFVFMGDAGLGLKSVTSPNWFYEGDAVATETALSEAGRGRSPDFSKDLRAQLLDKKTYSYAKAVCGSYKDYVPNHYVLGYHLISYGRYVWNADLWRVAHQHSGNTFGFTPFSTGIKRVTGMRKYQFYNLALKDLKTYWENQLKNQKLTYFNSINVPVTTSYTNYSYPYQLSDKSIIALKQGMSDIPTIVKITTDGTETIVREVASLIDGNPINTNGEQIIWVEEFPDIRWNMKSFSDIMLYDFNSQTTERITHKQHFYAPDISPDGSKIVCVEVTEKATYKLVILNAKNGAIINRYSASQNEFIVTPRWANDNKTIVCILQGQKGKTLSVCNTETGSFTNYTKPSFTDISDAFFHKKHIIYSSEHNGITNEIYAFDTTSKTNFQITNSRFGSRFASITPYKSLLYSTYTANGYSIASNNFDEREWKKSDFSTPPTDTLVLGLLKDEKGVPNLFDTTQSVNYKTEPYHKMLHIISPYAWGFGINTNNPDAKVQQNDISIFSQDKLGTFAIQAGYRYDYIGTKKGYVTLFYTGIYPVIQLDYEKGTNGSLTAYQESLKITKYDTLFHRDGSILRQIITFPFNLSMNNYSRILKVSASNTFNRLGDYHIDIKTDSTFRIIGSNYNYKNVANAKYNGYSDYIDLSMSFSNIKASPIKNIQPSWAQTVQMGFITFIPLLDYMSSSSSIGKFTNYVDRFYIHGSGYFPGLQKHHGFKINLGYTQVGRVNDNKTYFYNPINPPVTFARGYTNYSGLKAKSFGSFSGNYAFTLINPDIAIPSIIYLKRIRANIFYDVSLLNSKTPIFDFSNPISVDKNATSYKSFGIELISDNSILNCSNLPLQFGFRLSSIDPKIGETKRRLIFDYIFVYSF